MTRTASKSALVKELHDKGIPIPKNPTIDAFEKKVEVATW